MSWLGDVFGGKEGFSAQNAIKGPESLNTSKQRSALLGIPGMQDVMTNYSKGGMSIADALNSAKGKKYDPNAGRRTEIADQIRNLKAQGGDRDAFKRIQAPIAALEHELANLPGEQEADTSGLSDMLATDSATAGDFAREQLNKDDFYKGSKDSFNRAGENEQKYSANADADREAMSGKDPSYGLTSEDYKGYGQASGDIARMFGQQEQNLAQSLADRGLAAAPSGAAVQGFSGLMGNKNEQLSRLQTDIATKRIDTARDQINKRADLNRQLLGQTQSHMQTLGKQGNDALNKQLENQRLGRAQNEGTLNTQTQMEQNQQAATQAQNNEAMSQQQSTKEEGLGSKLGGAVLGGGLAALTGGASALASAGLSAGAKGLAGALSGGARTGLPGLQGGQNYTDWKNKG